MSIYQSPSVKSQIFHNLPAAGQYIFEINQANCPDISQDFANIVSLPEGLNTCFTIGDTGFSVDISCANISGTYHVVYGNSIAGGGLTCSGPNVSVIYPIVSVSPELPADCVVNSFLFEGSFDECNFPS